MVCQVLQRGDRAMASATPSTYWSISISIG
jgi:hypothetical protein